MSEPFFINDFKQNPDCYLDKEPAIVKELPEKKNLAFYDYRTASKLAWALSKDKIFYYVEENGKIYSAKISEDGIKRIIRCIGLDPEYDEIDFEEEEDDEEAV